MPIRENFINDEFSEQFEIEFPQRKCQREFILSFYRNFLIFTSYIFISELQIKIPLKYKVSHKVYLELINRYGLFSHLFGLQAWRSCAKYSLSSTRKYILGRNKKFYFKSIKESIKISSLRDILESRVRMSGNFLRVSNHAEASICDRSRCSITKQWKIRRRFWQLSDESLATSILFANQSGRTKVLRKKGGKKRESWFFAFYFSDVCENEIFFL